MALSVRVVSKFKILKSLYFFVFTLFLRFLENEKSSIKRVSKCCKDNMKILQNFRITPTNPFWKLNIFDSHPETHLYINESVTFNIEQDS